MATANRKKTSQTKAIERLLREHFPDFPPAFPPEAYRHNSASIRVRVVSSRFAGLDRVDRSELVYPILERNLDRETWEDITVILLLTPSELKESLMNLEFENPSPSRL